MFFKNFLFCNAKLKFLKRNLFFFCIFFFTSASALAGNDSTFYYFDCDTCIHFITSYESDSLVKCVSYTKEGDTIYYWDSRTGQYIVKISYEIDEFLTKTESWELMNINRGKLKLPRLEYESADYIGEMDQAASQPTAQEPARKMSQEEWIKFAKLKYAQEDFENQLKQVFFNRFPDGYDKIFENSRFRVVLKTKNNSLKVGRFQKYFQGRLLAYGNYSNNKPVGIWFVLPSKLNYTFDIRWLRNDGYLIESGRYHGFSLPYFFLPLILIFFFLYQSIRKGWYAKYFYTTLFLFLCIIPIAFNMEQPSNELVIFILICGVFFTMLSFINMFFKKESGTLFWLNIIIFLAGTFCLGLIGLISQMGKIGG